MEGAGFRIRPDHDAWRWLLGLADASGKLGLWGLRLSKPEFDVMGRAVIKHPAAEALFDPQQRSRTLLIY